MYLEKDSSAGPKPMKPSGFHILLVLAGKSSHGLGIAKAVDEATEGAVILGPGTLYRSLKELMGERLIREVGELTMKTGKRVSINELVTKILERHYKQKARGRRK